MVLILIISPNSTQSYYKQDEKFYLINKSVLNYWLPAMPLRKESSHPAAISALALDHKTGDFKGVIINATCAPPESVI